MPRKKGMASPTSLSPVRNHVSDAVQEMSVAEVLQRNMMAGTSSEDTGDLRYHHKKFKKMATTSGHADEVLSAAAASEIGREESPPERGRSSPSPTASMNGTSSSSSSSSSGRYVCPYCKMACAKPSVLQKHIRAHTNERPFPCVPCGFAFKTKSNLYKHCRSRAHAMKALGRDDAGKPLASNEEVHSELDEDVEEDEAPSPNVPPFLNSTPGTAYSPPLAEKSLRPGIYKPKFHTALYDPSASQIDSQETDHSSSPGSSRKISTSSTSYSPGAPSPEFLHRHISKIISENQAIVETMDPLWPRKYFRQQSGREGSKSPEPLQSWPKKAMRQISFPGSSHDSKLEPITCSTPPPLPLTCQANSRLALALLRPKQDEPVLTLQGGATVTLESPSNHKGPIQPLNLSINNNQHEIHERKRSESGVRELLANWSQQSPQKLARFMADQSDKNFHPQNPEGSIIKDLLLKARGGVDMVELLTADVAYQQDEVHSSQSYMCNLCKISYRNSENLEIHQRYYCKNSEYSSIKEDARRSSKLTPPRNLSRSRSREEAKMAAAVELVALATPPPFPSPGPLLGSTPLVGGYNCSSKEESPPLKKRRVHSMSEERPPSTGSLRSLEELSRSPVPHHRPNSLQMFGGKVHINDGAETKTMIIDPGRSAPNPSSLISIPGMNNEENSNNSGSRKSPTNIVVTIARSNLNSGGTIVQMAGHSSTSTCTSVSYSVSSITSTLVPDQQLLAAVSRPIVPKISTPSLAPSLHHHHLTPFITSQMSKLANYSPITLTPHTPQARSPDKGVVTILHGGREIPYVPGMPGPQSLSESRPLDLVCSPTAPTRHTTEVSPTKRQQSKAPSSSSQCETIKSPPLLQQLQSPVSSHIPTIKIEPEVQSNTESNDASSKKFLRPTSLPLKPGTFALKKASSLTPLSGTPLISPETPRPRKSYGQLYLNGHAYTYLGLKCSTRVFYCCLNRPQPMYVPQSTDPKLSMYSNWKVYAPSSEPTADLVGSPGKAMALYDSRHRPSGYSVARSSVLPLVVIHSSQWRRSLPSTKSNSESCRSRDSPSSSNTDEHLSQETRATSSETTSDGTPKRVKIFAGGFESNEEYIYVRGRGRGRYVCEECGIRCKKPSMLKKHIRTHTDVRPFTCKHCSFSFKTKGNLTKHMKSKAHYKKCVELGILPVPTVVDDSYIDEESLAKQQALRTARGDAGMETESEEEEEDSDDEDEDEDDDMGDGDRPEREAACSLLSLSEQHAGLVPITARPSTYPYTHGPPSSTSIAHTPTIVGPVSAHSEREKVSRNTRLAGPTTSAAASSSRGDRYYFPSRREQQSEESVINSTPPPMDLSRTSAQAHTPVTPVPDSAALLAALCSTVERLPPKLPCNIETPGETTMLHAYLTERALQDTRIKQHQVHGWKGYNGCSTATTPTTPTTPLLPPQSPMLWSTSSPVKKACPEIVEPRVESLKIESSKAPPSVIEQAVRPDNRKQLTQAAVLSQQHVAAAMAAAAAVPQTSGIKPKAEFLPPSCGPSSTYASVTEDGKSICVICNKVFSKPSQLRLHVNIHYFERPFRCESCAVSFRTKGHLQKHERSVSHQNKVSMNSTFGMPTTDNPRPFKCEDCKIAFRIHGHLAKHLRSKMHIMKLECLGKLPFGTYAEMERSGVNLNEIDTTDCDNSLESLQVLAQKMYEKDPSKLQQWDRRRTGSESSEDIDDIGEPYAANMLTQNHIDEGAVRHMSGSDYDEASEGENVSET